MTKRILPFMPDLLEPARPLVGYFDRMDQFMDAIGRGELAEGRWFHPGDPKSLDVFYMHKVPFREKAVQISGLICGLHAVFNLYFTNKNRADLSDEFGCGVFQAHAWESDFCFVKFKGFEYDFPEIGRTYQMLKRLFIAQDADDINPDASRTHVYLGPFESADLYKMFEQTLVGIAKYTGNEDLVPVLFHQKKEYDCKSGRFVVLNHPRYSALFEHEKGFTPFIRPTHFRVKDRTREPNRPFSELRH